MLTERKCQVSALPPSLPQLPHHTSSHPQLSISPAHNRQPVSNPSISPCRDAPHHVRPDAKPDTAAKSHTDGEPNKPEIENKRKQCQNPPFTDNIHSTHMTSDSVPPSPSNNNCPGKDTLSLPPAMSTANNDLSNALDANKPTSTSLESHYKKDHLLIQPPVQPSSPPSSHAQDMRSRSTAAKERKAAQQLQQQILGDSASELDIAPVEKKKERTQKSKKRSASPTKGNNKKRKRTENNQLSPSDSIVEARRSPSVAKEPRTQKAKKNSVSPAKAHGKKEKRSESGGSTPSRLPGRVSKSKESSRSRKSQVPSASQVQVRDLDPEAMEAAAVAAQAEKEEASRARRTTRLAAGKIKLVDYKSSANPHSSRALSPDGELDENDINNENAAADPPRTSRRRAAHNQSSVPQRSSRRVAKLKEKGQSSEDVENSVGRSSSAGNGSDDKGGANVDDMEIDIAVPSRANGTRDRKRTRESASKRSRHNTTEDGDYAYSKAYGTRASTRENSVIDAGEATDIGDANEFDVDEDVEAEEKLEDRTDLHGFTLADLTCIGFAVKSADSTDGSDVVSELEKQEEWGRDDGKDNKVYAYLKYLITGIEDFCKSLDIEREDEVSVEEALSFIATDCNRLRNGGLDTGMPRNVKGILKKVSAEMQHKNALERQRRKESRELEEMRHTLEKEMEMTRKSEMELSMAEVSVCEVRRALATEKARSWHVKKEIEKYKRMEADAKSRVEKAKLLFNQLRHEKHGPESGAGEGADDGKKGCLEKDERQGEKKEGEEGRALDESLTSNDDDATNKTPTVWTKRQLEMDRLRSLIAAREAEAEAFQREAEQERMKFLTALEIKNRLETELYMAGKPQSPPAQGAGNAGHASGSGGKTTREAGCSKKGDGRSGRGKNGAKSGNGGGPSHAGARVNGSNKGKSGGKNGESSKGTKRKSSKSQSAAEK